MDESILDLSRRTITKVIERMKLGCSNCGWDETPGDLHHIIPKSKGGSDSHSNLSHLCPNCHRKAHRGLITKFVSLDEMIGDAWKQYYFPQKAGLTTPSNEARLKREENRKAKLQKREEIIAKVISSDINFKEYGWVNKVAPIIGVKPQKVNSWMKRYMKEFLFTCFQRTTPS